MAGGIVSEPAADRSAAGRETTVVVPTRDRPAALAACLAALSRQTIRDQLEIVVVDDGSTEAESVGASVAAHPGANLVRTASLGPASARNEGAALAQGRFVLFTDDDCCPAPDWAERLHDVLASGAFAVAGRTENGNRSSALAEASQIVANSLVLPAADEASAVSFAPSNNIGCRAELLRSVPFDATYAVPGGEDRDWCARVAAAGHTIRLEPAARVLHFQRLDLRSFWSQQLRYGRGAYRSRRRGRGRIKLEPPTFYLRLLEQGARRGPRVAAFVTLAQVATAVGFAAEALRATKARR